MPIKISQLPSLSTVDSTVVLPVVDVSSAPISKKTTAGNLATYILAGNAATATKLQTARTINGVSFDGTANISISSSVAIATTSTLGGVIPDGTTITINGSGVISATPPQTTVVHAFAFDGDNNLIYTQTTGQTFNYTSDGVNSAYGLVDIGTNIYSYSLDANGNLIATFSS
jgi:hypothetical protein